MSTLVEKLVAAFQQTGTMLHTLNLSKQDKLPINGTAGQFLAYDFTFKTPAGGSAASDVFGVGTAFQVGKPVVGSWYSTALNIVGYTSYQMPAANWAITWPIFFRENLTIGEIGLYVAAAVASSNAYIGIYSAHPTHGLPYQRLFTTTAIATTSTGTKTQTIASKFTFTKSTLYWLKVYTTHAVTLSSTDGIYHPIFGPANLGNSAGGIRANGFNQVGTTAAMTNYFSLDGSGDGSTETSYNPDNSTGANLSRIPLVSFKAVA